MNQGIYSPRQIFWGTLFGGPFSLIYFLKKNFQAIGKINEAQKVVSLGLPVTLALLVLIVVIPFKLSTPLFIACAFLGENIARDQQFNNLQIPNELTFESTWKVIGVTIVSLLIWAAIVFLAVVFLEMAGVAIDA
jgi:Mn2+/Fe2+ NRAMP family transporter